MKNSSDKDSDEKPLINSKSDDKQNHVISIQKKSLKKFSNSFMQGY